MNSWITITCLIGFLSVLAYVKLFHRSLYKIIMGPLSVISIIAVFYWVGFSDYDIATKAMVVGLFFHNWIVANEYHDF